MDFRSLGVREFGTIYEGLLESELALADTDLTLDNSGVYSPVQNHQQAVVAGGEAYLHNRSGARKASGSYYTKSFAVNFLLDSALNPALDKHFKRLDALDDDAATKSFFDFRVADIAMGSGHFLVGATDRVEKRMTDWIADRPLPGIRQELDSLRIMAQKELGNISVGKDIEDSQLLRRLIARRCIYGVDINRLSVQLARLAIWIHTFVPGLPLSFLDHNLVCGNALIGIGTIDEIRKKFREVEDASPLWAPDTETLLGAAQKPLQRLANINDATLEDIAAARSARQEARTAVAHTENLCDFIVAQSTSDEKTIVNFSLEKWSDSGGNSKQIVAFTAAKEVLKHTDTLHFPIAFPEVFLRDRPGFDVILGNPPWQEVTVEEDAFWARHFPGFRGLSQGEQEIEKKRFRKDRKDLGSCL